MDFRELEDRLEKERSALETEDMVETGRLLLTIDECSHALGVSSSFFRHLMTRGLLPGVVRIGSAVRVRASIVRQIAEGTITIGGLGKTRNDDQN